jgi:hypothetical protein
LALRLQPPAHCKLFQQFNGTQFLVDQIQLPYNDLLAKEAATLKKEEQREDRYDDLLVADNQLDDQVRTVFRRSEEYDRANPADASLPLIFPEGKFGHIISMNMQQEPDTVEKLALRIESLEKDHPLLPLAKELRDRVAASRKAIKAYEESIKQLKTAQAEEDIAKATLRRQYEINYLDARKQLGKTLAERLFPKLNNNSRSDVASLTSSETA